jgi:hypothetical protein
MRKWIYGPRAFVHRLGSDLPAFWMPITKVAVCSGLLPDRPSRSYVCSLPELDVLHLSTPNWPGHRCVCRPGLL